MFPLALSNFLYCHQDLALLLAALEKVVGHEHLSGEEYVGAVAVKTEAIEVYDRTCDFLFAQESWTHVPDGMSKAMGLMAEWAKGDPQVARSIAEFDILVKVQSMDLARQACREKHAGDVAEITTEVLDLVAALAFCTGQVATAAERVVKIAVAPLESGEALLNEIKGKFGKAKLEQLHAAIADAEAALHQFPEGHKWKADFKGTTAEELEAHAASAFENFEAAAFQAKLGRLSVAIREVVKMDQLFSKVLPDQTAELAHARDIFRLGTTVFCEGALFFHLDSTRGNPLSLKKKINATINECKAEVKLVDEASLWGLASLHELLQEHIRNKTKFGAA